MDKILPHNLDSERIVIGSIIYDLNAFNEVSPILTPEMFYSKENQDIYRYIVDFARKNGKAPDVVLLMGYFRGSEKITNAIIDFSFELEYYDHARNIQEKYIRRLLWRIGSQLAAETTNNDKETDELLYNLNKDLLEINQDVSKSEIHTLSDAYKGVYRQIESNLKGESLSGADTGFSQLNKASGGLQKSDLIIIAGETSQGKTSLALSIANAAARAGNGVAIYSLEMKKEQLAARLLSMNTGLSSSDILFSKLDKERLLILDKGVGRTSDLPIYFDDNSTATIDRIISSIRTLKAKYGISGVVVDYLQILNVNQRSMNKEAAMADVARRLKNLAKELDIWVIALSQLNRDINNPAPNLNRLRDSGQIAEAADNVIFVYRPEVYGKQYSKPFETYSPKGTALIHVAKGRNIGLIKFVCGFDSSTTKFYELNKIEINEDENPF